MDLTDKLGVSVTLFEEEFDKNSDLTALVRRFHKKVGNWWAYVEKLGRVCDDPIYALNKIDTKGDMEKYKHFKGFLALKGLRG